MQITWLGTPRQGLLGDPVPQCPAGMAWSATISRCVVTSWAPTTPGQTPQCWPPAVWDAAKGRCVQPAEPGFQQLKDLLQDQPPPAASSGSSSSALGPVIIVAGVGLALLIGMSAR